MRIVVVTNMYPPHHLGGYELSCRDTVERWRRAGHDVEVLTSDLKLPDVATPPDDGVHRTLRIYWKDGVVIDPGFVASRRIERHNRSVLDETIRRVRPDVVSVWHMGAMSMSLLGRTHGVPLVCVVCDDWMIYGPDVDAYARRLRSVPRLPDGTIACFVSTYIRDRALTRSSMKPSKHAVVPTGIDTNDFPIATPDERPWRNHLLSVGRVEPRKGVHVAIDALAQLPDTTLTISGRGEASYVASLEERARANGVRDRVTFTVTPRDRLRTLYASADAFLFPVTWDEPFGLTPVEAMACATPVVGTARAGSLDFLVDGTNCLAVESDDATALARAVERLRADDELRQRIVRGGLETASKLTVDRYAHTLEAWHRFAAGEGDQPA